MGARRFALFSQSCNAAALGRKRLAAKVDFKRTRVTWRQIYTFSHAATLGWTPGLDIAAHGFNFLTRWAWMDGPASFARRVARTGESVWHGEGGKSRFLMEHAYWGPQFDDTACEATLDARKEDLNAAGCTVEHLVDEAELCRRTAAAVSEGKVIGWFHGRMEWGPRALGNRSIVCDPRRSDMKEILNAKI